VGGGLGDGVDLECVQEGAAGERRAEHFAFLEFGFGMRTLKSARSKVVIAKKKPHNDNREETKMSDDPHRIRCIRKKSMSRENDIEILWYRALNRNGGKTNEWGGKCQEE
jgi:hypothetical protein